MFIRWLLLLALPLTLAAQPRLYLAGDSTMANKPHDVPNPEYGWGEKLPAFFRDPAVIVNHATNGRSTKSFITEGRWEKLLAELHPGDWVIIEFGHNDEKSEDRTRYAAPRGDYAANLRRFIADVRAKECFPVLATPIARRHWSTAGQLVDTHGDYPAAMREVAAETKVPLLELNGLTMVLESGHGVEGSKALHLYIAPGTYAGQAKGWQDDTHLSAYGAERVAGLAVQEILRLQLPLASWLRQ